MSTCDARRRSLFLRALALGVLLGVMPSAWSVDLAATASGATVEAYEPPHGRPEFSGRAALGDGKYTLFQSGVYPQVLAIDLGQPREVKTIAIEFRRAEYKPDTFALDYRGEDGVWRRLKEEKGWAQAPGTTYRLLLERTVVARGLRLTVHTCGFDRSLNEEDREKLLRAYGDSALINRFSAFSEEDTQGARSERDAFCSLAAWQLATVRRRAGALTGEAAAGLEALSARLAALSAMEPRQAVVDDAAALARECAAFRDRIFLDRQAALAADDLALAWLGSLERTRQDRFEANPNDTTIRLDCAGNECEDAQLVLLSNRDIDAVDVAVSPLRNAAGDALPAGTAEVFQIGYIHTEPAAYPVPYQGAFADILSPVTRLALRKGQTQPLLVGIRVPAGTAPGLYHGAVVVSEGDRVLGQAAIALTVWGFALPEDIGLRNVFSFSWNHFRSYYGRDPDDTTRRLVYDVLLQHRLNPTSLYVGQSPQPELEMIREYSAKGMSAFNMGKVHGGKRNDATVRALMDAIVAYQRVLTPTDLKKAFIYLTDEPVPGDFATIVRWARQIRAVTSIPLFSALNEPLATYPQDLLEVSDIVCALRYADAAEVQALRQRGKEVWWYIIGWGFKVDEDPLRTRLFPWVAWHHGYDGVMQWVLNHQWCQVTPGLPVTAWTARSLGLQNGTGNLVYPGPDGMPLASLRLKNLRDGLEDYEYALLLRKAATAHRARLTEAERGRVEALLAMGRVDGDNPLGGRDIDQVMAWRTAVGGILHTLASGTQPARVPPTEPTGARPRVGVYDSRAIAVAFVGSEVYMATDGKALAELRAEHEKAKAAGDTQRMATLEAKGKAQQAQMHQQAFSTAPVDAILAHIADQMPGTASAAGVAAIVSAWDRDALAMYPNAERVDVTMALVDAFRPNDRQRKSAIEVQKHPPISLEEAGKIED